jgi:hypothetical protein
MRVYSSSIPVRYSRRDSLTLTNKYLGESIAVHDPGQKTLSVRLGDLEPLTTSIPSLTDLFLIPPNHTLLTCLIGITETFEILQIHVMHPPNPSLTIYSTTSLPKGYNPVMIMPVDPMVWKTPSVEVLLSISAEGDLEFWAMDSSVGWRKTGRVKTNRKNIARARCSSTKKTVLGTYLTLFESSKFSYRCSGSWLGGT